jgi:hypothetical membrane protein
VTTASRLVDRRWGLWAGVIGPILFIAVFLVEGAIRPGYDPIRLQVSYLSLGEGGWFQQLTFLVSGALILWFAASLRGELLGGAGAMAAPLFIGLAGVGLVIAGVFSTMPAFGYPPGTPDGFPTDIPTTAYVHVSGALCLFVGLIVAPVAMARRFRRDGSTAWAIYSGLTAVVVLVFQIADSADASGRPVFTDLLGLVQRIALIAGLGWLSAVAYRYLQLRQLLV